MKNQISIPQQTNLIDHPDIKAVTEFQCKDGYCGACLTTIISGEAAYYGQPLVQLRDDEVLPCVCRSVTTVVLQKR